MGKAPQISFAPHIEHPSFETVWVALQEVAERQKETERILKENAQQQAERQRETDRQMKETDRRLDEKLGKLGDRFGEMIEHMVMPGLV